MIQNNVSNQNHRQLLHFQFHHRWLKVLTFPNIFLELKSDNLICICTVKLELLQMNLEIFLLLFPLPLVDHLKKLLNFLFSYFLEKNKERFLAMK